MLNGAILDRTRLPGWHARAHPFGMLLPDWVRSIDIPGCNTSAGSLHAAPRPHAGAARSASESLLLTTT